MKDYVPVLMEILDSDDIPRIEKALVFIEKYGDVEFISKIEKLKNHESINIRYRARRAAGKIRSKFGIHTGYFPEKKVITGNFNKETVELENVREEMIDASENFKIEMYLKILNENIDLLDDELKKYSKMTLKDFSEDDITDLENILLKTESKKIQTDLFLNSIACNLMDNVKDLLKSGADVNSVSETGHTALMMACFGEYMEIAELLVKEGADVNTRDENSYTALMHSTIQGNIEFIKFLIGAGGNINARDKNSFTVMMQACNYGYKDIVKYFIDSGVKVNVRDDSGITALMIAVYHGFLEITEMLIDNGARIDVQDKMGFTALMKAAVSGENEMFAFLLEKGADTEIIDKNGMSALVFAVEESQYEITELLLKHSADVNKIYMDNVKVLQIAEANKDNRMIDLLRIYGAY